MRIEAGRKKARVAEKRGEKVTRRMQKGRKSKGERNGTLGPYGSVQSSRFACEATASEKGANVEIKKAEIVAQREKSLRVFVSNELRMRLIRECIWKFKLNNLKVRSLETEETKYDRMKRLAEV